MTNTLTASDTPVLYRNSHDRRCRDASRFLGEHGIAFLEKNIDDDAEAAAHLSELSSDAKLPVLKWKNGEILSDFSEQQLVDFLHKHDIELEDS